MNHGIYLRRLQVFCLAALLTSCHRGSDQPNTRRYDGINLPQIKNLRLEDHGGLIIFVSIEKTGALSICNNHVSLERLDAVIKSLVAKVGSQMKIHIGADVDTPFDKVWPVIVTCRTNDLTSVGFAVTDSTGKAINVIRAHLPRRVGDTTTASPLVLREDSGILTIRVDRDSFMVANQELDHKSLLKYLQSVNADSTTILVIPSSSISHGRLMIALAACREVGFENNVCIMEQEAEQGATPPPSTLQTGLSGNAR